ncbi:MAG: signal peptidase I [Flavobacteriaceae bacterium]|nr:signal peptidase I [Flavobacteriaceae bacterium]
MTLIQLFYFFLAVQVLHFLGTYKLYVKAGRQAWEALIPIYNAVVLMQIINRPKWWVALLFVPIINLLMFPVVWVETIRSFGHNSSKDTWLAIVTLGLYVFYFNYVDSGDYIKDRSLKPRTNTGEWVSSIVFAIVAATMVHTYFMQPYTIPTSSLEKSLLVGDFLFVSKFHYGARTPMTPIAAPMVHDTLPLIGVKSYLSKPQLPYFRFPGLQSIKRNDIVVFNWPADTVQQFFKTPDHKIRKPVDKKSNYVKRCVGIAGDTLSVVNGYVYINGKQTVLPDRAKPQFNYTVYTDGQQLSKRFIEDRYGSTEYGQYQNGNYRINLTANNARRIAKNPLIKKIERESIPKGVLEDVFPHDSKLTWNRDFLGPIYIPEKGKTVAITLDNLPFYNKIIGEYEKNDLKIKGNSIYINGKIATSYTFKQNYYWMMGDNRDHSEDSRYWGFVPFDHVVGKPVFIWMSWNSNGKGLNKVRWERLFTTVGGSGKPVSYFYYFLGFLALWFGFDFYRKRVKS